MKDFNLRDYINEIVAIAERNGVGAADAVEFFVVNLNSMSNHYKGADSLNIRELGQAWNKLNYKVRNKQRTDVVPLVAKRVVMPGRSRREE